MSVTSLFLWIVVALLIQLAVLALLMGWRYWKQLQSLKLSEPSSPVQNLSRIEPNSQPTSSPAHVVISAMPGSTANQASQPVVSHASWQGNRSFVVAQKSYEDVAESICSFYLKPLDGLPLPVFLPGQFLTFQLALPSLKKDNLVGQVQLDQAVRCYSLSDAHHPDYYRVSIKKCLAPANTDWPKGRVSHYFHEKVQVGDVLQVRAPSGQFYLSPNEGPVVLIAGGIGLTPLFSMLQHVSQQQAHREVWLFYGARQLSELMELKTLIHAAQKNPNLHLKIALSDVKAEQLYQDLQALSSEWGIALNDYFVPARVSLNLLRQTLPFKPFDFYICGPAAMMESLVPELEAWGVDSNKIHFEAFGPATVKRQTSTSLKGASQKMQSDSAIQSSSAISQSSQNAASATDTDTQLVRQTSGKQLQWQSFHTNMLDVLESHGIQVQSACRSGSCGTCQTRLISGQVEYENPPSYSPEQGTCLVCVGRPLAHSTVVLDL